MADFDKQPPGILKPGDVINDKYTVLFFLKRGSYAQNYRVSDKDGTDYFFKLLDPTRLRHDQFDKNNIIREIHYHSLLKHKNISRFLDNGTFEVEGEAYPYFIADHIPGETVADRLIREGVLSWRKAKKITSGILHACIYMHHPDIAIVHNDINHENVMLDMQKNDEQPVLIDFGHARHYHSSTKVFYRKDLNPFYMAPECYDGEFNPATDLYAISALMYHMLYGLPPWFIDISVSDRENEQQLKVKINQSRQRELKPPSFSVTTNILSAEEEKMILPLLQRGLSNNPKHRFGHAAELLAAIQQEPGSFNFSHSVAASPKSKNTNAEQKSFVTAPTSKSSNKGGFADIAGMEELKETLQHDVIEALKQKELYESYGLTVPNGLLLYGPPGCGKSYFALKLAEEAGYTYIKIKPSDLASIYVHGTQEKIGKLFDEARQKAPSIINFEEFDALVPNRDGVANAHQFGEVNEFLTQLDNCGRDNVLVLASSNQPNLIDPAVLRAGRFDKLVYVSEPDLDARTELFRMYFENRPLEETPDYAKLAELTQGFVAADINNIANKTARKCLRARRKIKHLDIVEIIRASNPSVSPEQLQKYQRLRNDMEHINTTGFGRKIGFH